MRSVAVALAMVAMVAMVGGCANDAKVLAGPMHTGPGENSGVHAKGGVFGWEMSIVGPESVKTDSLTVNRKTGEAELKGLEIQSSPVEFTDAQTRKMAEGLLPLAQENTRLQEVYGENTAKILAGIAAGGSQILDSLPAGQLRRAVVEVVEAIVEARAQAVTSQPVEEPAVE